MLPLYNLFLEKGEGLEGLFVLVAIIVHAADVAQDGCFIRSLALDLITGGVLLAYVLYQVEQYLGVKDPVSASVVRNLVDYLKFKCDLGLQSLHVIRLQILFDKCQHRVF